jgi:two-component sensor histidine kinase
VRLSKHIDRVKKLNNSNIKVLLIEDNPGDTRLIQEMITEAKGTRFDLVCVGRLSTGLEYLSRQNFDIVLTDLSLPDSYGLSSYERAQAQAPKVPIVVLTSLNDETVAIKAVRQGAQDYLVKGQVDSNLLGRAMRYAIERKKAEEQIKASLKEKEVLLKELHHRVKNNLQVILSLLNLQSGSIRDRHDLEIFKEMKDRIKTMALIHEKLYHSENLDRVNFSEYIRHLISHLFRSYAVSPTRISLKIDVDDIFLNIDRAIPCSLLINELVSNSIKHAFPNGRSGEIRIIMHSKNSKYVLTVGDNGIGLKEDFDFRNTESLGLQLVCTLTQQLSGSIKYAESNGTTFKITFPM